MSKSEMDGEYPQETAVQDKYELLSPVPLPHEPSFAIEDPAVLPVVVEYKALPVHKRSLLSRLGLWSRTTVTTVTANPKMLTGICILGFFVLVAIFGPLLLRHDPAAFSNDLFQPPSSTHWLGTTQKGEDIFSQVVAGTRASLLVGCVSAIGATALSVFFGLVTGYFGGLVDEVLSLVMNIFLVIPSLPLAIVLASFIPFKGPGPIIIVLLITSWAWGARVLRAQTLTMRSRDFVQAARAVGETPAHIIFAEILPNEIAIVSASFVSTFIYTILADITLEFLGLGDVSVTSWGNILYWAQNDQALLTGGWWLFIPPGLCIALLGAGLAFLNYGIDDLANPRLRKERTPRPAKPAKKEAAV